MVANIVSAVGSYNWKAFVKGPFSIILVAALAFLGGRYTGPTKTQVVTVDKVVETQHEQTQVVQQIDVDKLLEKIQDKIRYVNRDVVRTIVTKPDGSKTETDVDKSQIDSEQKNTTNQQVVTNETTDIKKILDEYRAEEKSKSVTVTKGDSNTKYRLGVFSGYSRGASGLITGVPGLVVGAFGERKLLGPISGGIWGSSQPGFGLQLSVSF